MSAPFIVPVLQRRKGRQVFIPDPTVTLLCVRCGNPFKAAHIRRECPTCLQAGGMDIGECSGT